MCACGRPLHYWNPKVQQMVQEFVDHYGPDMKVVVQGGAFMVPRHYIALHGLTASELPELAKRLGFRKAD
jgi:hypothetical protein